MGSVLLHCVQNKMLLVIYFFTKPGEGGSNEKVESEKKKQKPKPNTSHPLEQHMKEFVLATSAFGNKVI